MDWLEQAILDYLHNNENKHFDSVDITTYFKLPANIVMNAIQNLKEQNKIERHQVGLNSWYTTK